MSEARIEIAAAVVGGKVFFAGGFTEGYVPYDKVDIYDVTSNSRTTAKLSEAKGDVTAVTNGNKAVFVGS